MGNKIATYTDTISKLITFRLGNVILDDIYANIMVSYLNLIIKDLTVDSLTAKDKWNTLCKLSTFVIGESHTEIFKCFVQHLGIDLYYQDLNGDSYLHKACNKEAYPDIVDWLIRIGFDVNITNNSYISPIFLAQKHENIDIQEKLVKAGAIIDENYNKYMKYKRKYLELKK